MRQWSSSGPRSVCDIAINNGKASECTNGAEGSLGGNAAHDDVRVAH